MNLFSGELHLVSDGALHLLNNNVRVPALRIGEKVIRGSVMSDELFGLLQPGEVYSLAFGRMLFWRWLLRIETRGTTHRCGVFSFFVFNAIHAWLSGMAIGVLSAFAISSHQTQSSIAVLGGLVMFAVNLKTWIK